MSNLLNTWFRKKETKEIENVNLTSGVKVADYPKQKYNAYWEIIENNQNNEFRATVKFYSRINGKVLSESLLIDSDQDRSKVSVDNLIKTTMESFKV